LNKTEREGERVKEILTEREKHQVSKKKRKRERERIGERERRREINLKYQYVSGVNRRHPCCLLYVHTGNKVRKCEFM
jgi:hypothetical protein